MPSGAAVGAWVVLPFGEKEVKRKEYSKKDAGFNHKLRSARPECLLQILCTYW